MSPCQNGYDPRGREDITMNKKPAGLNRAAVIKNERDREILKYGLVIGSNIANMQNIGVLTFTWAWSFDSETASWAEEIIFQWANSLRLVSFNEYVIQELKEREQEYKN